MIKCSAKYHDDSSVEFKFGFSSDKQKQDYSVNTWIFVPGSLDIDPEKYGKEQFYRDIKSNVRLITPVFSLPAIASDDSVPLQNLREAMINPDEENFDYHIKLFGAIYKSALRDYVKLIVGRGEAEYVEQKSVEMVKYLKIILERFRSLPSLSKGDDSHHLQLFALSDEYICRQTELRLTRVLAKTEQMGLTAVSEAIQSFMACEKEYKVSRGFESLDENDSRKNGKLLFRYGLLKKFTESELYIHLKKKRDGFAVEQIYYSLAAGLAMIFATSIAWAFQIRYGNITMPLFVALVISYMLKDRIKELMRYYFAHKRNNRFFDHKAHITIAGEPIGTIKEGVDFIPESHTPPEVLSLRLAGTDVPHENRMFDENILLFRQNISISHEKLLQCAAYPVEGINEILRLHLHRFTLKMDNPEVKVETLSAKLDPDLIDVQKLYKVYVIIQLKEGSTTEYKHYCMTINREGLVSFK